LQQKGPERAVRLHHRGGHRPDALWRQPPAAPQMAMAAKLPVDGETTTCSGMAWGFNPYLMSADPYKGAMLAVVDSVTKLVAAGFRYQDMYLTFQEYFERLG